MIVSCPSCDSKYKVPDEKVANTALRTRCKACGSEIVVNATLPPPPGDGDVARIVPSTLAPTRTRTSKPPPPVRKSIAPAKTPVRPSQAPSLPIATAHVVRDVKSNLDPTAAPDDFYAKILEKVRPQKPSSVPPAQHSEVKPTTAAQNELVVQPTLSTAGGAPAAPIADIEIPIEMEGTAESPSNEPPNRRTSSPPPLKPNESGVQLPPIAATPSLPAPSQIVLPGQFPIVPSSLATQERDGLSGGNDAPAKTPHAAESPNSRPTGVAQDAPNTNQSSLRPVARVLNEKSDFDARRFRRSPRRKLVIAAVAAVGLLGIVVGVASTVATNPSERAAPQKNLTALPAAASTSTREVVKASRPAPSVDTPSEAAKGDRETGRTDEATRSVSHTPTQTVSGSRTVQGSTRDVPVSSSLTSESKAGRSASATIASKSTTPTTAPTQTSAVPFNREAALAVLGLAASQVSSCKRPGGPTGSGKALVTFDPGGKAIVANIVSPGLEGTAVARCVSALFQRVKVAPFAGERQTVSKAFAIPE